MVVSYARRLLSLNDQIVHLGGDGPRPDLVIRIGTPERLCRLGAARHAGAVPRALAGRALLVRTDFYDLLLRELRSGGIDVWSASR